MKWNVLMELKGAVVSIFEDYLEVNGILIPNCDRDEAERDGAEGCAIIYGDDYDAIAGPIESMGISFGLDALQPYKDVEILLDETAVEDCVNSVWSGFHDVVRRCQDRKKVCDAVSRETYVLLTNKVRDIFRMSGLVKGETCLLRFHRSTECLPCDSDLKVVICRTQKGVLSWNRAYYSRGSWHGSGSMSGVIAWASLDVTAIAKCLGLIDLAENEAKKRSLGVPFIPEVGMRYKGIAGLKSYTCVRNGEDPLETVLVDDEGWLFTAICPRQYPDGTISWSRMVDGQWLPKDSSRGGAV